jgi:hypothetical protein
MRSFSRERHFYDAPKFRLATPYERLLVDPARRRNIALPVELTFQPSGETANGISMNISATGVLVNASKPTPRGTVVRMKFKKFSAQGEVMWTKDANEGFLLGMQFAVLGWRARRVVRRLVEFDG